LVIYFVMDEQNRLSLIERASAAINEAQRLADEAYVLRNRAMLLCNRVETSLACVRQVVQRAPHTVQPVSKWPERDHASTKHR
jgi:hypothetical protein